jgi:hypothetical protein
MGGLCSFMGARVMAHTSLECTCLEKGRAAARRRKSSRCSGSSLLVPSSRLCGTFSAASPACSSRERAGFKPSLVGWTYLGFQPMSFAYLWLPDQK